MHSRVRLVSGMLLIGLLGAAYWRLHTAADPTSTPTVLVPPSPALVRAPSVDPTGEIRCLNMPVEGVRAAQLVDSFNQLRGTRLHEAIDIASPAGTPVHAISAGRIAKLFLSKPGGITIYQFDPTDTYAYYYAHLARYADGLAEGQLVACGDLLGYVGSTGNASPSAPHLHFAIFKLGPEKHWWQGEPINPYPALGGIERNPDISEAPTVPMR